MKKTKVICTMGPNTNDRELIKQLALSGMDIARFNFSHGDHEEQAGRFALVKSVREEINKPIATLLDTKGPEIRTGVLKEQVHYRIDNKGITVSLNDVTETLGWDKIYKIKFDGANIDVYMTTVNANIIPVRDFNGRADEFIRMAQQHLKPFQIKVDVKKMNKAA